MDDVAVEDEDDDAIRHANTQKLTSVAESLHEMKIPTEIILKDSSLCSQAVFEVVEYVQFVERLVTQSW